MRTGPMIMDIILMLKSTLTKKLCLKDYGLKFDLAATLKLNKYAIFTYLRLMNYDYTVDNHSIKYNLYNM